MKNLNKIIQNSMPLSVITSIKPIYCELIVDGKKTIEVRKTKPKLPTPFKVYIYETLGKVIQTETQPSGRKLQLHEGCGKVIGEFTCNKIEEIKVLENGNIQDWNLHNLDKACLSYEQIANYIGANKTGYAWYIKDLILYKIPNDITYYKQCYKCEYFEWCLESELSCSGEYTLYRPPQSWCYIGTI